MPKEINVTKAAIEASIDEMYEMVFKNVERSLEKGEMIGQAATFLMLYAIYKNLK